MVVSGFISLVVANGRASSVVCSGNSTVNAMLIQVVCVTQSLVVDAIPAQGLALSNNSLVIDIPSIIVDSVSDSNTSVAPLVTSEIYNEMPNKLGSLPKFVELIGHTPNIVSDYNTQNASYFIAERTSNEMGTEFTQTDFLEAAAWIVYNGFLRSMDQLGTSLQAVDRGWICFSWYIMDNELNGSESTKFLSASPITSDPPSGSDLCLPKKIVKGILLGLLLPSSVI